MRVSYARILETPFNENLVVASVTGDRKSTRLNSSHSQISYAVFCLKKKKAKCVAIRQNAHRRLDERAAGGHNTRLGGNAEESRANASCEPCRAKQRKQLVGDGIAAP